MCLLCTILPQKSIAEDTYVDSLVYKLGKATNDTAKFQLLNDLSDNAANGEWEKYELKGNYQLALESKKLAVESIERYNKITNQKSVIRFQYKSEFDKKEIVSKKEILKQKILRNGSLGVLSVVLVFGYVFLYQRNKINVSESTFRLIKNDFEFEYRGKVLAKNKGEIDLYYLSK